jgi:hypothetical protein
MINIFTRIPVFFREVRVELTKFLGRAVVN